ncbi:MULTISPECIES: TlpA disulfide reductase family protein [unclassified Polaribacter]|uniref:TlpA family protein disulfide reductase n=1 Tax=unclassified Polaribacter TaxID=196858 RepID=UPI001C5013C9|nr:MULTISPECIES: TlpA disulfide reductase family protein [unclassified Polaribacter]QXP66418.1 TlpA family protein disulfide reductase [Polaribacter sp. AHE13PA]QXP71906.1 TlpA family protein disulfide reductase [Polaribacter sp. R2A056_3_33]
MKNTILSLSLLLGLVACSKKVPVDYAILTGEIENLDAQEITLIKLDQSFKKKIPVVNGVFSDTINANPGLYSLSVGKNNGTLYLNNGSRLNLIADAKDFNNSLKISGEDIETTNYLLYKKKTISERKGKGLHVYTLEEPDFKNKFKEIHQTLNTKLDTAQGISSEFKTLEKRNLNYEYLNELQRYAGGYHRQWANKKSYKPSEFFLAESEDMDLDNGVDFQFSSAYKEMVNRHYTKQVNALRRKDTVEYGLLGVTVYSSIPNQVIKNELIFKKAEYDLYQTKDFEKFYELFINASTNEENNAKITKIYNEFKKLDKGQPSPKFTNYEKHSGGTLSLGDLKGKYVYIDVWATWCIPCIKEIPDLKRIEKAYHGKNISFLSISVDKSKDHDKWKKMVVDKDLGGIQVIADNNFKSEFISDYIIKSIPRFILIDPNGVIVSQNAPKPSDPELMNLLNELDI